MKVHFIAIGGSVMHNLALSLAANGHTVTGSDDVIHSPSRERLQAAGLLPPTEGWDPERITQNLDAVILGMHAKADNPELQKAQELGLRIYSFPEFVREHSANKQRVVIAGSHGKTSITAMLLHVLHKMNRRFDYLVGAQLPAFERMVELSDDAPVIILEGDEYPISALDARAKFLAYEPHLLVLTGISWDHINAYPTEESYHKVFAALLDSLPKGAVCIYNKEDKDVRSLVKEHLDKEKHYLIPYETPVYKYRDEHAHVKLLGKQKTEVLVYGEHNMSNMMAAVEVLKQFALPEESIAARLSTFPGADLRLQEVYRDDKTVVIRDWAHAPSKVKASIEAVAERYRDRQIVPVLELHTYSSLNPEFMQQYNGTFGRQRRAIIYIDPDALARKGADEFSQESLQHAFGHKNLELFTSGEALRAHLQQLKSGKDVFLMMTSGNFGGIDLPELGRPTMGAST